MSQYTTQPTIDVIYLQPDGTQSTHSEPVFTGLFDMFFQSLSKPENQTISSKAETLGACWTVLSKESERLAKKKTLSEPLSETEIEQLGIRLLFLQMAEYDVRLKKDADKNEVKSFAMKLAFEAIKLSDGNIVVKPPKPEIFTSKEEYVYIVKSGIHYKIGRTGNIKERLSALKTTSPQSIELIHTIATHQSGKLEKELHEKFKLKQMNREWFALDETDLDWLLSL